MLFDLIKTVPDYGMVQLIECSISCKIQSTFIYELSSGIRLKTGPIKHLILVVVGSNNDGYFAPDSKTRWDYGPVLLRNEGAKYEISNNALTHSWYGLCKDASVSKWE